MVIDLQLILAIAAGILIIINLLVLFLRKDDKKLQSMTDAFYRGQAELAGRLSQMAETNQQQQNKRYHIMLICFFHSVLAPFR